MEKSGVRWLFTEGRSLCTISRQAENARNSTIISAKEPVIRNRFFLAPMAWWMPREVSTFSRPGFAAWAA